MMDIDEAQAIVARADYHIDINGDMEPELIDAIDTVFQALECTRWIPVSDRLPEKGGYVLAVFETCLPFVAMYYSGIKKFSCEGEEANPTHWMPLPEPPQEVE